MGSSVLIPTLILFGLIFVFLSMGMWVGVCLAVVGLIGLTLLLHGMDALLPAIAFNSMASYTLAAIPLFVFMGQIIFRSGLNKRLYRGVSKWVGILPGALVHSNIVSCTIFAAASGSSAATAATMGIVAYPEQVEKRGYDSRLVLGSLAAGGTLGILIPPSVVMIIYGGFVGVSVGRLFMAGVVPGIITALLFMLYIFVVVLIKPHLVPGSREKVNFRYFLDSVIAIKDIWPILVLIFFILGSIYGGFATPTEAGAVSCFIALLLTAAFKQLNFDMLKSATLSTVEISGMIVLVVFGASVLGSAVSLLKIPALLSAAVLSAELGKMIIWLFVVLLYLVLGCFISGIAMILLTLPVTYPLMIGSMGFDPIWFGVTLTMLVECGAITPPVGVNLYVLQGITKQKDLSPVVIGSLPFFGVLLVSIAIFTFFPQLVLFLPNMMFAPRW